MLSIEDILEHEIPPYTNKYEFVNHIESGDFGKVYEGRRKDDSCRVAMKLIDRRMVKDMIQHNGVAFPLEYELMTMASSKGHPGIIKPYECFGCSSHFLIVMEFYRHSIQLMDYITENSPISEPHARLIFHQIVLAVQECHNNGVIHRDLKLDNWLINPISRKVKLIDFGSGEKLTEEPCKTIAGSKLLHPPEWIIYGKYNGEQMDTWALGIVLYAILQDEYPFSNQKEILDKEVTYDETRDAPSCFCSHLIEFLLRKDPADRIQLRDITNHIWMDVPLKFFV